MKHLKLYDNYGQDDNKIWIIGIPSGNALHVDKKIFGDIYDKGLLKYHASPSSNRNIWEKGFFAFEDNNLYKIERMLAWSENDQKIKDNRECDIQNNFLGNIEEILKITNHIRTHLNIYAKDNILIIKSKLCRFQILMNEDNNFEIEIYINDNKIEHYIVPNRSSLINRIEIELSKYLK